MNSMNYIPTVSNLMRPKIFNSNTFRNKINSSAYTTTMKINFEVKCIKYNGTLVIDDLVLNLRGRLILTYTVENNNYLCDYPELNIYAYGESIEDLEEDIKSQIYFSWKEYACEEDINLTEDAIEFKNKLKECFTEN